MKLWVLTEISGEAADAVALLGADDPAEARWLLREKTGEHARVCTEIDPERGIVALVGFRATKAATS
jgi:hypothetical protein